MLRTPVAFLIFNRPELTRRVFAEIARAKPRRLLVVADGPRTPEETEKCAAARAVVDRVDWECEVLTNFSDVNLGCKRRVSSGLDWVFEQCEEAIILEDDCLPHPTFFRYCAQLLERYRDDERVMVISGDSFLRGKKLTPYSYYFSRSINCWGWASWRRAWQHYDVEIKLWPLLRETSWLLDMLSSDRAAERQRQTFDQVYTGHIDTWDYQLLFSCWAQNGLGIIPNVNLVSNIGFGDGATHTKGIVATMANLAIEEMVFPLVHPPYVVRDGDADDFSLSQVEPWTAQHRLCSRIRQKLSAVLPAPVRRSISALRAKWV